MADRAHFEKAEWLVSQLPFVERLKLVARICEQLSAETAAIGNQQPATQPRLAEFDSWLAECDALRGRIRGGFDATKELRQVREERASQL